ncbi:hypothetical protein [Lacrimispora celerecrescens]|uniref:hypothetical protein n=1 Tax=Lacrimispora celerecrescens TaxID=29354 RepID=UPI001649DA76|nr:hypothetical protein [Lacrimispora celerecrescens]
MSGHKSWHRFFIACVRQPATILLSPAAINDTILCALWSTPSISIAEKIAGTEASTSIPKNTVGLIISNPVSTYRKEW